MSDRLSKLFSGANLRDRWSRAEARETSADAAQVTGEPSTTREGPEPPTSVVRLLELASLVRAELLKYDGALDMSGPTQILGQVDAILTNATNSEEGAEPLSLDSLQEQLLLLEETLVTVIMSRQVARRKTGP